MSEHSMITRSKKKDIDQQIIPNGNSNNDNHDDDDDDDIFKDVNDIDEYGNFKNLIELNTFVFLIMLFAFAETSKAF